jgi:hypothetical protein
MSAKFEAGGREDERRTRGVSGSAPGTASRPVLVTEAVTVKPYDP